MLLGAVWGLLTSTRLLRGRRTAAAGELLLAGRTTRRRAGAQALAGLRGRRAVGAHRGLHGRGRPRPERQDRGRAGPLLRPGDGGHRGHVPRRRRRGQPAGAYPPPGRVLRGRLSRRQLRRADDRQRRPGTARADLGVAARLGGGAAALLRAAGPLQALLPIAVLTGGTGRRDGRAGRRPRRRRGHPARSGAQRARGCGCCRARPAWRSDWPGRPCSPGGPRSRCRRCCSG